MTIDIRTGDIHLIDLPTRMPFKYGIATMTSMLALVRLGKAVLKRVGSVI